MHAVTFNYRGNPLVQQARAMIGGGQAGPVHFIHGAYLQDCNIADVAQTDDMSVGGVKPWATDPADARRLWALSAEMTGVDAFGRR